MTSKEKMKSLKSSINGFYRFLKYHARFHECEEVSQIVEQYYCDDIERDLDRLEELKKENQKLKEIIKDNFDYNRFGVFFVYDAPVMEKEIKEVLKNE